jgi:hypothetical protein
MQPGDLRRFKTAIGEQLRPVGQFIVILEITKPRSAHPAQVSFLCDGQVEEGWGYPWVMDNSEVINEAR